MSTSPEAKKIELLLIKDTKIDQEETILALQSSTLVHSVRCIGGGEATLQILQQESTGPEESPLPDLVLLDLEQPRKDGREMLKRLKAIKGFQSVPIVALIHAAVDEIFFRAANHRADTCINKPRSRAQIPHFTQTLEDFWQKYSATPPPQATRSTLPTTSPFSAEEDKPKMNYRALVVEDNASDRLLIKAALASSLQCAFEIEEVGRVIDAEASLEKSRYDIIVADLGNAESGFIKDVRSLVRSAAGVPVVVLTALDNSETGLRAIQEGAADYVVKSEMNGRVLARTIRFAVERNRIEEQMRHAQRMESLGVLAGGIAHDFNNLLMVIRGNAELQQRLALTNPQIERTSGQVLAAADRAATLTRQLLAFGRRERIHLSTIDLNETISEFAKMVIRLLGPTIELKVDLSDDKLPIAADPSLLEQVIMNLAVNARDAMPEGGVLEINSRLIKIAPDRARGVPTAGPGPYAEMVVRDNGTGMSPEMLPRIFEPFYTTKDQGRGTGLGLSTTFGIVRQHRGTVEVDSTLGEGTQFTVLIPLSKRSDKRTELSSTSLPRGNGETILVVDDEQMVRDLTVSFLEMYGYRVKQAESGAEVIRRWDEFDSEVELVLTDLIMPEGVSGRDLGSWLSKHKPDLKVIYCSGFSRPHLTRKFKLREDNRFLAKPYSSGHLLSLVREVLDSGI
jgi:signal transduction histidine kinase